MSNLTSDELHHAGRKGMKWGMNIFGRRRTGSGGRFRRDKNADPKNVKIPKKLRKSVDERMREAEFLDMYRSRDNMSTKALKSKIARLEAERKFKELVEAPEKARREALQKKKQARLAFVGKAASAALDVYSKVPSSVVGNGKSGQAAKDAIEAFKKKQEWAKAFKDVPTTMTKFTQSINVGGVDVYIPESVQNRFMIQHSGRKGMKWGRHIFGDPNKRAFNKAVRGTRRVVKAFESLGIYGKRKYDEYNSQQGAGKRLFKSSAPSRYRKDKIDPNVRKSIISTINNHEHTSYTVKDSSGKETMSSNIKRYSKPSWDFSGSGPAFSDGIVSNKWKKGAINHFGVNMGEIINGVYIPSQDDLLLHYGKKGMKWKKGRQGMTPAQVAMADAEEREANRDYGKEAEKYKKDAAYYQSKIKGGVEKGKARNKKEQKYLDKHEEAMRNYIGALDRKEKQKQKKATKKVKHSGVSDDILMHYGKKGMKWKKKGGGSDLMTPAEAAANEARVKKDDKAYNYNLKMRDEAIKNALKRGASGKEIRRLQDMHVEDQRKVDMNNRHKKALKNKDNRRSSYSREVTVADAKSGKLKTYKY